MGKVCLKVWEELDLGGNFEQSQSCESLRVGSRMSAARFYLGSSPFRTRFGGGGWMYYVPRSRHFFIKSNFLTFELYQK